MQILKNSNEEYYDIHLLTKALSILAKYHCKTFRQSKLLFFSGILECVREVMKLQEMSTTKEASILCAQILKNPDDMVLWLKFDNPRLTVNSACTDDNLIIWGEPNRLPQGRGLYRNWGAFFDFGDVIEVAGGIQLPTTILE
mmetsp:Transcript_29513/g.44871  ORF Transcript_29513/g.44871 Transcript_29513/m.44871 type:complete len:142 (+) Transcript_29513:1965-2390(+)